MTFIFRRIDRWAPAWVAVAALSLLHVFVGTARAHPLIEDALDIVIDRDRLILEARISPEQILIAETDMKAHPSSAEWGELQVRHGNYLADHLRAMADGTPLTAKVVASVGRGSDWKTTELVAYRLEYAIPKPPHTVQIEQSFLSERSNWTVSCVMRIRQETQSVFETALLRANEPAVFDCVWTKTPEAANENPERRSVATETRVWPTVQAYATHGVLHILTGYDHLLFVTALVLASRSVWDLVKVVSAFTLAHTLTLTLAVLGVVSVSERVVEPIIAASIVLVALQNVLWREDSRGWARIAVAFGFGLFHGLGFAGGLKDAMAELPSMALWTALISFSVGVELGHQVVVIPLYASLQAGRRLTAAISPSVRGLRLREVGSALIAIAGVYFLIVALSLS